MKLFSGALGSGNGEGDDEKTNARGAQLLLGDAVVVVIVVDIVVVVSIGLRLF